MKRVALLIAASCGLALGGGGGCGELPDPTAVVDLRVLAVKCEPAGFLVDLDHLERASQMDYTARVTALVVGFWSIVSCLFLISADCCSSTYERSIRE